MDLTLSLVGLVAARPGVRGRRASASSSTRAGPIFFRQLRMGCGEPTFEILKFRTMTADAEERKAELRRAEQARVATTATRACSRSRTTRGSRASGGWLRRFSIDELPQLINVVRGEMSLVGPAAAHPRGGPARRRLAAQAARPEARHHRPLAGARARRHPVRGDGRARLRLRDDVVACQRPEAHPAHAPGHFPPARGELTDRRSAEPGKPAATLARVLTVTVVIPAYNAERTLGSVLDALSAQSNPGRRGDRRRRRLDRRDGRARGATRRSRRPHRRQRLRRRGPQPGLGRSDRRRWSCSSTRTRSRARAGARGLSRALAEFPGAIVGCARTFRGKTPWGWVAHLQSETPYLPRGGPRRVGLRLVLLHGRASRGTAPVGPELRWRGRHLLRRRARGRPDARLRPALPGVSRPRPLDLRRAPRASSADLRTAWPGSAPSSARGCTSGRSPALPVHYFALVRLLPIYRRIRRSPELREALPAQPAAPRGGRVDARGERSAIRAPSSAAAGPGRREASGDGGRAPSARARDAGTVDLAGSGSGPARLRDDAAHRPRSLGTAARPRRGPARAPRRAVDLGVDFFDTADAYGPDECELLVAEALHPYRDLVVATKGGLRRHGPGRWSQDGRPEHLRAACEGSLRRLRVDCIELYQLHSVDPAVPLEESLGALAELRAEGKIRRIGICNVTADELDRAARRRPRRLGAEPLQRRRPLGGRRCSHACEARGIAFVAWAPLAKGYLTRQVGGIGRAAAARGATPGQLALAWVLARSPVTIPIPGTRSPAHLEENVAAVRLRLDTAEVARTRKAAAGLRGACVGPPAPRRGRAGEVGRPEARRVSGAMDVRTARSSEEVEALRTVWNEFERDVVNADLDYHLMIAERPGAPSARTSCWSSTPAPRRRSSSAAWATNASP